MANKNPDHRRPARGPLSKPNRYHLGRASSYDDMGPRRVGSVSVMAHQSLTVDLEGAIRERMVVRRVPLDTDDNWWYIEYLGCEHIHGEGQVCMVVLTEDQRNMLLLERTWGRLGKCWKMLSGYWHSKGGGRQVRCSSPCEWCVPTNGRASCAFLATTTRRGRSFSLGE